MEPNVDSGYVIADSKNLPEISSDMIFNYIAENIQVNRRNIFERTKNDYIIDNVQLRFEDLFTCVKANVFIENYVINVIVLIDPKNRKILSTKCEVCNQEFSCDHVTEFLFWLHRETNDKGHKIFWNMRNEGVEPISSEAVFVKNVVPPVQSHYYDQTDDESPELEAEMGDNFLQVLLDEMEKANLNESQFYIHHREVPEDEFEPLYLHHIMLNANKNLVQDFKSFMMYMEDVSTRGLFSGFSEVSAFCYKRKIWLETQYCRIRCSIINSIMMRQDESEDEYILSAIFGQKRHERLEERKLTKEHKRFILKQTEKLENKEYRECGLLLNESYPYICASPDGITDDHIVEIKIPRTDEEFEKYLVGKETIAPKYMSQMQIQMYLANVQKALFCVLSPDFETNGAMHYVWVQAELQQVVNLLGAAEEYWRDYVFPELRRIYLKL